MTTCRRCEDDIVTYHCDGSTDHENEGTDCACYQTNGKPGCKVLCVVDAPSGYFRLVSLGGITHIERRESLNTGRFRWLRVKYTGVDSLCRHLLLKHEVPNRHKPHAKRADMAGKTGWGDGVNPGLLWKI